MSVGDSFRSIFLYFFLGNTHIDRDSFHYYQFPSTDSVKINRNELPIRPPNHVRIVVVSDTHNRHDRLGKFPSCDLFVHCGDILMTGKQFSKHFQLNMLRHFDNWMSEIPAEKRIIIAGNHDDILHKVPTKDERKRLFKNAEYLENESIVWKGIHIWASPISHGNSPNKAFQSSEFEQEVLSLLPSSVDILITHGHHAKVLDEVNHKIHLFGHSHNSYGISIENQDDDNHTDSTVKIAQKASICVPICDGTYRLKQLPVIIDFPIPLFTNTEPKDSGSYSIKRIQIQENDNNHNQQTDTTAATGFSKTSFLNWFNWRDLKSHSKIAPDQERPR